jgi:glutamyl-Q tRNA(Asp) synthetase
MTTSRPGPVGRFAPSPTGELHFGSLVAAVGSFLSARSRGGRWLVRVEDIDPPREVAGSAGRILADLEACGLVSDGPVLYQSSRLAAYQAAMQQLLDRDRAFPCACTRSELPPGGVYQGTCRDGLPPGREARSIRARVTDQEISFTDGLCGVQAQRLDQACGDFVIRRADGLPAYQLAVVVDDAYQGISEVVRGADLLSSTPRQIHLLALLGHPRPDYLHLPLVLDEQGRKLGKRLRSDPLNRADPAGNLRAALQFLGQQPPALGRVDSLLAWAIAHWRVDTVPRPTPASCDDPDGPED